MQKLHIKLAGPRGFCAGVERAILMVERALEKFGAPVYVRHQIVHNRHVVEDLERKGAVFVKELDEIPTDTKQPVMFSAHGVSKAILDRAKQMNFFSLDATCPLVSKVHREVELHHRMGKTILMIGHKNHPEVLGTTGQLPDGVVTLVETVADVATLQIAQPDNLAYVTQTTLSLDETADIIAALRARFPNIAAPKKEDICYATTNRQEAIKVVAPSCDLVLVIGGLNSSNSTRLAETALRHGARQSRLIEAVDAIDWSWFDGVQTLGLSSGASAPDHLIHDVVKACRERFDVTLENVVTTVEDTVFNLPRLLAA